MNKLLYIFSGCCFVFVPTIFSQSQSEVNIGNQIWTSKNLDVSTFRNGDPIKEARTKEDWCKARNKKTAAYCYYDYDSKNDKVFW